MWQKSPQISHIDVVVYFRFQYGATYTKSGNIRWCLQNMMTHLHTNMDAREKRLRVFLTFAMENHALSTYMGIKLFKIGTNKTYSTQFIRQEHGLCCLGTNHRMNTQTFVGIFFVFCLFK